jgi:hypothetical protein
VAFGDRSRRKFLSRMDGGTSENGHWNLAVLLLGETPKDLRSPRVTLTDHSQIWGPPRVLGMDRQTERVWRWGSLELFARTDLKLQSSRAQPPRKPGLQA